jgi:hypothetical protein
MASLRKRYVDRIEAGPRQDEPPVMTPPVSAAKLPDAVEPKSAEPLVVENPDPVRKAEKDAIALQLRLREMERAEVLQKEAIERHQQQPPHAAEPPQQPQPPAMPAHVQEWLSRHPQYTDPHNRIAQLEINLATEKCVRDGLTWNDDAFLPSIERHLGIAPRTNGGQSQHRPIERPSAPAAHEVPPRQQQRSSVPMSAPPTREVPSMASGRVPSRRLALTPAQIEAAHASGISLEEYERQLRRYEAMKAAGQIDDR